MTTTLNYYESPTGAVNEVMNEVLETVLEKQAQETIRDLIEDAVERSVKNGSAGLNSDAVTANGAGYTVVAKLGEKISVADSSGTIIV